MKIQNWFREKRYLLKYLISTLKAKKSKRYGKKIDPVVKIAAFFSSSIGLGEGARRQYRLLDELSLVTQKIDLTDHIIPNRQRLTQRPEKNAALESNSNSGIVVFHVNPPEFPTALKAASNCDSCYRIGYWVYELDDPPIHWQLCCPLVDEIWVPSEFAATSLRKKIRNPIYVLPLPIKCADPTENVLARYGSDHKKFTILTAYDVNSSVARKNPYATIKAFKEAFPNNQEIVLIIKVSGLENWSPALEDLENEIAGDERIIIISEVLSEEDMAGLVDSCNVILSLHRSEGFGLLLAEAMARGKPVVSTAWSGNMDFMDSSVACLVSYELVPVKDEQGIYKNGMWAEPDVKDAAQHLQFCFHEKEKAAQMASRAKSHVNKILGSDLQKKYSKRLNQILEISSQSN